MPTTIPAAKAAIRAAIQTRAAIVNGGVPVLWGQPTDEAQWVGKTELIHLGRAVQDEEWGSIGGQRRDEQYTIEIVVMVHGTGLDTEQETETRAYALRDEISAALHADPTLGGALTKWCELTGTVSDNNTPFTTGWGVRLVLAVSCQSSFLPE